jgi:hypothetical protein
MRAMSRRPDRVCVEISFYDERIPDLSEMFTGAQHRERKHVIYTTAEQRIGDILEQAVVSPMCPYRPSRSADAILTPGMTRGRLVGELPRSGNIANMPHYKVCVRAAPAAELLADPERPTTWRGQMWPNARRLASRDFWTPKK